jgi:2-(1,2-epoxy-1,2-dihydrophenyl)acetyl-CoA isomerase
MASQTVKFEIADGVAVVTLNDPASLNAFTSEMGDALLEAFDRINAPSSGIRSAILTGAGRSFCAGANLAVRGRQLKEDGGVDLGFNLGAHINPLVLMVRDLRVPLIAAVNGPAVGVGLGFALMADLIFAAESSYFMSPFCRVGLVPDGGMTYAMPRLMGKARAMELALFGNRLPAAKALECGMINRVLPDAELMPGALEAALQLARGPSSLGAIRQLISKGLENELPEQLELELVTQRAMGETADYREGVFSFLEKRAPRFPGY